jgi:hypothetical protein
MPQPEPRHADPPGPRDVTATAFIDAGHPDVRAFAERTVAGATTDRERISRLFTAARDEIRYDPYQLSYDPQDYGSADALLHPFAADGSAYMEYISPINATTRYARVSAVRGCSRVSVRQE